jgi:streptogramin lyase
VAIVVMSSGGGGVAAPSATGSPVSIKAIDLPAGTNPGPMWGEGSTVLLTTSDGVRRVGTSGATTTFATPGHPTDVAEDPTGRVWVAETSPNAVIVFNNSGKLLQRIPLSLSPALLAVSQDAVWVGASGSANIARINSKTLTPSTITAPNPVGAMGEAYGRLWVASSDGALSALDDTGKPTLKGPQLPGNTVAVGHSNGVWFAAAAGPLTRVDPRTSPNIATNGTYAAHPNQFHIADPLPDIASFEPKHLIWVGSRSDETVVEVGTQAPNNNKAVTTLHFHAQPGHLAVDAGGLWVSVPSQHKVYQVTSI